MADLSDDDIATLWAMACERERPTREMVRAFAHAVLAADRALNAPQAALVASAEPPLCPDCCYICRQPEKCRRPAPVWRRQPPTRRKADR